MVEMLHIESTVDSSEEGGKVRGCLTCCSGRLVGAAARAGGLCFPFPDGLLSLLRHLKTHGCSLNTQTTNKGPPDPLQSFRTAPAACHAEAIA